MIAPTSSPSTDDQPSSFRQIIRSSSIIGGASVLNVIAAIARMKVAALVLGPAGIGLIGLFQNLVMTASSAAALGVGIAGTRQIAEASASDDTGRLAEARRALLWLSVSLAVLGGLLFWLLRHWIARQILGDLSLSAPVGWLSLGVGVSVVSTALTALLTGLRRIGDVARASVAGGVLSALVGSLVLLAAGERGIILFVLLPPLLSTSAAIFYARRVPRISSPKLSWTGLVHQWRVLATLGAAFMIGGLASSAGPLIVRIIIQRELGATELGFFQAVWALSTTYVGFVLQAMALDYAPRLTAAIGDLRTANRLVNEQTEVAILFGAPILLLMIGLAPWLLQLLYSSAFAEAATLLRWQVLGDLLKLASWPIGFLFIALGRGKTFLVTEISAITMFVLLSWIGIPAFGLEAAGLAYVGLYLFYFPVVYVVARALTGFAWTVPVKLHFLIIAVACSGVVAISFVSAWAAAAISLVLTVSSATYTLHRFRHSLPALLRTRLGIQSRAGT